MLISTPYRLLLLASFSLALSACDTLSPVGPEVDPSQPITAVEDGALKPATAAEHEALGTQYLSKGLYGLAEQEFRKSVEINPHRAESWIGLAAAYDNLRRFDLADRAYLQVRRLLGPTAEVLNNEGYSQLMRGNLRKARALFEKAHRLDPNNPVITRNLAKVGEAQGLGRPHTNLPGAR